MSTSTISLRHNATLTSHIEAKDTDEFTMLITEGGKWDDEFKGSHTVTTVGTWKHFEEEY